MESDQDKMHVLLVTSNLLLRDVLQSLLANLFTLQIHWVMCVRSGSFLQGIKKYRPEVVVLEESLETDEVICFLGHVLNYGRVRLILVNSQGNQVRVLDKYQVSLTQANELINLVTNSHTPTR